MDDERRLVERVLTGDRSALRELITRYERLVRHVVQRLLDDPADAEEVLQDVFMRVYRGLPDFRTDAKLSTWIGRIAYNSAVKRLRRDRGPTRRPPGETVPLADAAGTAGIQPLQLDAVVLRELREHVRAQVARLPPDQRVAVTLHHVDGLSVAEVAEIMGAPENTVKSHLFRGRKTLKELLKERISDV